jgi:hypothetical protein
MLPHEVENYYRPLVSYQKWVMCFEVSGTIQSRFYLYLKWLTTFRALIIRRGTPRHKENYSIFKEALKTRQLIIRDYKISLS